ncbi:MAG: type II secretion system F family protein [Candidatus Nealsonbacteria bacterium]
MKFNYQGRTKQGDIRIGSVEASSQESAINLLQGYGLYVTLLEKAKRPIYAKNITIFSGVSRKDIVLFSRQLSIMFKSKVSLIESLRVLASQMKNADFKEKVFHISEDIEAGTAFSKSLSQYPKIFSPFYVAMVKSGELSGKLSEVLDYLSKHLEKEYHLVAKAKGALIYPALVVFVVILVIGLLVFFVIPNLTQVLESSGQELPAATRMVISSSEFLKSWGWIFIFIIAFLVVFISRYKKTELGTKTFDSLILKIPMLKDLLMMIYVSRFSENLSTLISGGLPIVQALETTGDVIGNVSYKEAIAEAKEGVRKGNTISSVLAKYPELFPAVFNQMVIVGEQTGNLDNVLMDIVDFYQKEIDTSIDSLLAVMEPLLIVFLGGIVGGVMLSILTPMYKMMTF